MSCRHDDDRVAAEEDGAAAVKGEIWLEEGAVPGELVVSAHHAAQDPVESLPTTVGGVTQPEQTRGEISGSTISQVSSTHLLVTGTGSARLELFSEQQGKSFMSSS